MLFLSCDEDLTAGELVEISGIAGLSCKLNSHDLTRPEDIFLPDLAIFCEYTWIDYKIDRERVPVVLHAGQKKIVSRGRVSRVTRRA